MLFLPSDHVGSNSSLFKQGGIKSTCFSGDFSLHMHAPSSPSLIGYRITITSLSHPCCRHYTFITLCDHDLFSFFVGICYGRRGLFHRSIGYTMSLARFDIMRSPEMMRILLPPVNILSSLHYHVHNHTIDIPCHQPITILPLAVSPSLLLLPGCGLSNGRAYYETTFGSAVSRTSSASLYF